MKRIELGTVVAEFRPDEKKGNPRNSSTPPEPEPIAALVMLSSILLRRYCKVVKLPVLLQYIILSNHAFHWPTICHKATVAITGFDKGIIIEVKILT